MDLSARLVVSRFLHLLAVLPLQHFTQMRIIIIIAQPIIDAPQLLCDVYLRIALSALRFKVCAKQPYRPYADPARDCRKYVVYAIPANNLKKSITSPVIVSRTSLMISYPFFAPISSTPMPVSTLATLYTSDL